MQNTGWKLVRSLLCPLLVGSGWLTIVSSLIAQPSPSYNLEPEQQFRTRLERGYVSKPVDEKPQDLVQANSRLTRYRRLEQLLRKKGKSVLKVMFDRKKVKHPKAYKQKTLSQYMKSFFSSTEEVKQRLRRRISALMILYARIKESVQLKSTVKTVTEDGHIHLKTRITFYGLRWDPGGSSDPLRISTDPRRLSPRPAALSRPFRFIVDRPFHVTIAPDGNVLVQEDVKNYVKQARLHLSQNASVGPFLTDLLRTRLLTEQYFRDLLYQAWARQFEQPVTRRKGIESFVLLPPLFGTGKLRKRSFSRDERRNRQVPFYMKSNDSYLSPSQFGNLFRIIGNEKPYLDVEKFAPVPRTLSKHALGRLAIHPKTGTTTSLAYRETAYRSKPKTRNKIIMDLARTFVNDPHASGSTNMPSYSLDLEHENGYHLVHRFHISLKRKEISSRTGINARALDAPH